ncbi:phage tail spike protein [Turicibacter sanguinis]|uniref:phage tail spike protein n=1 Tax=Turicibacter sanguinis TaxID=154288 RepID=UPI0006C42AEC|nr:phage tail spike protein [Turicibacter sanguinis]CUN12523.1 phage minor structural protein%2C N-terminal region [Turicibacter sanguinis]
MLTLFDVENTKIGLLENLKDFVILEKLKNGSSTISFSLYRNDPYCKQIKEECYIETSDNRYIVKIINDQQTVIRYTCELDLESLTSKIWYDGFSNVRANVVETVKLAIAGTGWTVIDGGVNEKKRTINLKAMDSYEIIKNCLTKWDVEVKFDAKKRMITLADKIGSDKGVYFSDEFNLTTIHVESDSRSFATRLYVRGKDGLTFASINGGKDYIEDYSYTSKLVSKIWIDERYENVQQLLEDARLKLNDFCKPKSTYELEVVDLASLSNEYSFLEYGIGDSVTLLSAGKEIREVHRIVEIAKYPLEPERNTATLSNGLLTFEESQEKNDAMAENVDSVLNEDGTLNGSKVDGITTEQIVDFEAKVVSVVDLSVVNAKIENLEASKASIEQLSAVQADIGDLRANTATIDQLKVTEARISVLEVNDVKVNGLLEASSAKINILEATSAEIKHLLAGNLSSENIQAGGITSDKLTIANGFIKDAMIDSLNANKITAGQINTALVQVASSSGNLVINDNTIQIRDANRVRVQIGKDASNDYSMSVWDPSGKLMFDARGLKADAIKEGIIRNDMISAHANIDGSKLNISSVVSEINEGSTNLKASKVQIDGVAQTLEVAFNLLKTQADGTKSQTESNTTAINVAQGKINTLIQDTTITKDGQTVKLKDEYSKLEQTVGSLSSTIGKQQTIIDDHTGKITAFNSEMVSLKQNLNGLSANVSSVQTTLQSHSVLIGQKANSMDVYTKSQTDAQINLVKESIILGISQTYETKVNVEKKIDEIQVGGRNLIIRHDELPKRMVNKDGAVEYWEHSSLMNDFISVSPNECLTFSQIKDGGVYDDYFRYAFYAKDKVTVIKRSYNMDDVFQEIVPEGAVWLRVSYKTGNVVKLERGNKVTDWTPAPEDVQASIDTKANSVDVYVKSEVYTKSQTDSAIQVAKDSINLGVSSTYETKINVESKINGVNSSISALQQRVSTAEQKITDTAITNLVKQNFYTKEETETQITSKGYATSSEVQQTSTSLIAKFSASGGYNAIRNSGFLHAFTFWGTQTHNSPTGGSIGTIGPTADWGFPNARLNTAQIRLSNQSNVEYGLKCSVDTTIGKVYTIRFRYAAHRVNQVNVIVRNGGGGWHTNKYIDAPYTYSGGKGSEAGWGIFTHTFRANNTSHVLNFVITNAANDGFFWVAEPMVFEGDIDAPYSPHPSEVYWGQTLIDQNGIRVNASNVGTYTEMHAGGFFVKKNDGNLLFEATNKIALYDGKGISCISIVNDPSANYGNARIDLRGGINFIHNPGQDVGINQILLGNDDRSDKYGFHNMSIRCWNSFGFQDNYGYTNMFADVRRGRWIMKGALYQNTQTPPATFSMNFDGEDEIYNSGYERSQAIDSVMNLKTGVYVDNDGECCSAIYGGYSELITTEYQDEYGKITTHLNHEALNASLVVTCQEQQKLIKALQKELNEIKEYLNVA